MLDALVLSDVLNVLAVVLNGNDCQISSLIFEVFLQPIEHIVDGRQDHAVELHQTFHRFDVESIRRLDEF